MPHSKADTVVSARQLGIIALLLLVIEALSLWKETQMTLLLAATSFVYSVVAVRRSHSDPQVYLLRAVCAIYSLGYSLSYAWLLLGADRRRWSVFMSHFANPVWFLIWIMPSVVVARRGQEIVNRTQAGIDDA